jgi:hypothetical protein
MDNHYKFGISMNPPLDKPIEKMGKFTTMEELYEKVNELVDAHNALLEYVKSKEVERLFRHITG